MVEALFILIDKKGNIQRFSHYQKGVREGNYVSVNVPRKMLIWKIETYIMIQKSMIAGVLKNLEDDSRVKTSCAQ